MATLPLPANSVQRGSAPSTFPPLPLTPVSFQVTRTVWRYLLRVPRPRVIAKPSAGAILNIITGIVIGVIGTVITTRIAQESLEVSREALELDKWTAMKDWLEICRGNEEPACRDARSKGLPPPPLPKAITPEKNPQRWFHPTSEFRPTGLPTGFVSTFPPPGVSLSRTETAQIKFKIQSIASFRRRYIAVTLGFCVAAGTHGLFLLIHRMWKFYRKYHSAPPTPEARSNPAQPPDGDFVEPSGITKARLLEKETSNRDGNHIGLSSRAVAESPAVIHSFQR